MQYPEGHVSKSIYAIFRLVSAPTTSGASVVEFLPDLCVAIWTTTPWTIPANAGKISNMIFHVCAASGFSYLLFVVFLWSNFELVLLRMQIHKMVIVD